MTEKHNIENNGFITDRTYSIMATKSSLQCEIFKKDKVLTFWGTNEKK